MLVLTLSIYLSPLFTFCYIINDSIFALSSLSPGFIASNDSFL